MMISLEDHAEWLKNKNFNPITGKRISSSVKNGVYSKFERITKIRDIDGCYKWLENKTVNPITGRKIKPTGRLYKQFNNLCSERSCWNDNDPITFDDLRTVPSKELIMIGKGEKKHCFLVESLYEYYKTQTKSNMPVRNPVDSSARLTHDEIKELTSKMKRLHPDTKKIRKHPRRNIYKLMYQETPDFYHIFLINRKNEIEVNLGVIPSFLGIEETGSTDRTSATVLSKLFELHENGRLLTSHHICCNIHLGFKPKDWFDDNGRFKMERFQNLAYEIDQLL
jgi:hypothetical protein